jgi:hypothetical protein
VQEKEAVRQQGMQRTEEKDFQKGEIKQ